MAPPVARRRVATVLFIDIVGSTALATELGDGHWRVVLARFRQVVRRELKRCRGREQDTAGDSFYATFAEPAQALRAAATLSAAVQEIGLDVRAGLHTGECEEIDGKLTGIAVHIGARVMAIAGAAEVLATRTTRDLVVGSGAGFEEAGIHELKGVEGEWLLYRLLSIEERLPSPLEPEVAAERLAEVFGATSRRRRWPLVVAAATGVLAAVAGLSAWAFGGSSAGAVSLLQLDPHTGQIVRTIRDGTLGCPCGANLFAIDGTLWERSGPNGNGIAVRNMTSGRTQRVTQAPAGSLDGAVGFGSLWLLRSLVKRGAPTPINVVQRRDELSGRVIATIPLTVLFNSGGPDSGTIAVGNGAVWALQAAGTLNRIDPLTNKVTGRFETNAIETNILLPTGGYEWICECRSHEVLRYDARTRTGKTFHFPEQPWHLVEITTGRHATLWLMDEQGATLTEIDPRTGKPKQPLGLNGTPTEAVQFGDSIWVAAGSVVDRIKLPGRTRTSISLPKGMNATGIAADPATGRLWINNSYPPPAN